MERRGRGGNWEVRLWAAPEWAGHGGGQGTDRPTFAGFDGGGADGNVRREPTSPRPSPPTALRSVGGEGEGSAAGGEMAGVEGGQGTDRPTFAGFDGGGKGEGSSAGESCGDVRASRRDAPTLAEGKMALAKGGWFR